jgi:hypothetical protein
LIEDKFCQIALIRQNIHQGKLCIQTHLVGQNLNWRGRLHSSFLFLIAADWWLNSATRRLLTILVQDWVGTGCQKISLMI